MKRFTPRDVREAVFEAYGLLDPKSYQLALPERDIHGEARIEPLQFEFVSDSAEDREDL